MKNHLWIIVVIVVGFSSFMIGYSVPPFLEVGFGDAVSESGLSDEEALRKQYEELYKESE
ncbi:MAG: hypothetical protein R3231_01910 [bacterium]|nr:hypothetical protein [bacterium]